MDYKNWYSIQVAAGCERKVQADMRTRKTVLGDTFIQNIEVPEKTELVVTNKGGKRKTVKTIILPGYVLLQVIKEEVEDEDGNKSFEFPQVSHDIIRSTPNVLGFTGSNKKRPRIMSESEVRQLFSFVDETHTEVKQNIVNDYYPGDTVTVIDGPFTGSSVKIEVISANKLVTYVDLCGRMVRTELTKDQVYKK